MTSPAAGPNVPTIPGMVEKLTKKAALSKYGPWLLALLLAIGNIVQIVPDNPPPSPPPSTTTTTRATTTTSPPTTTTTAPPSPAAGDETAALTDYIKTNAAPVINRRWQVDGTVDLSGMVGPKTITFTPAGLLDRTVLPIVRILPVIKIGLAKDITITGIRIRGIEPCAIEPTLSEHIPTPEHPGLGFKGVVADQPKYDPKTEAQMGVWITASSNITLTNGLIEHVAGDGIYIAGASNHIRVNNVSTYCTGRSSISNVGSTDVAVTGGRLASAGIWNLNIEPDLTASVDNYTVTDVTIGWAPLDWLFSAGPNYSCKVTNVRIVRPTIEPRVWPWYVKPCTPPVDIKVTGCISGPQNSNFVSTCDQEK